MRAITAIIIVMTAVAVVLMGLYLGLSFKAGIEKRVSQIEEVAK